jgi:hypothetical protein
MLIRSFPTSCLLNGTQTSLMNWPHRCFDLLSSIPMILLLSRRSSLRWVATTSQASTTLRPANGFDGLLPGCKQQRNERVRSSAATPRPIAQHRLEVIMPRNAVRNTAAAFRFPSITPSVRRLIPSGRPISDYESPSAATVLTPRPPQRFRTSRPLRLDPTKPVEAGSHSRSDQNRHEQCTLRCPKTGAVMGAARHVADGRVHRCRADSAGRRLGRRRSCRSPGRVQESCWELTLAFPSSHIAENKDNVAKSRSQCFGRRHGPQRAGG